MNKIRPFREEPNLLNKIGVALFYIVLGWVVANYPIANIGNLLSIFFILGLLVWVFIIRKRSIKYFVRYHVVQALLLYISLVAILWLLLALFNLMSTIPGLNILVGYLSIALFGSLNVGNVMEASAVQIVITALAFVMGFYAIRARYTELPWITDGVRHWI